MADNATTADPGTVNSGAGTPAQVTTPATVGEPAKTYTQADLDKIVNERSERAGSAALSSYYQQNGMTPEEAKQAVEKFKTDKAAKAEADKGNLTAMQKKAEEADARAEKATADAFNDLVEAKTETIAVSLGIDPAKLPYIRLDFSKVGKDERGKPKAEDIKAVLTKALEVMPAIKSTTEQPPASGFKLGADGANNNKSAVDTERMRKIAGLKPKKE